MPSPATTVRRSFRRRPRHRGCSPPGDFRDGASSAAPGPLARAPALRLVMVLQRGPVTDQPQVAERVDEAALPVNAPGCFMVADLVDAAVGSGRHGALDESVRIVGEYLDPD